MGKGNFLLVISRIMAFVQAAGVSTFELKTPVILRRPALRRPGTASPYGRRFSAWLVAGLAAVGLATAGPALAIGLGNPSGAVVLGQPLRIEIPLLGAGGELPASDCFRIRPAQVQTGAGYALKAARIEVVGASGQARLLVSTTAPLREPVIEFGITVSCGFDLTKDYVLLGSPPVIAPVAAAPALPVVPATAAAVAAPPSKAPSAATTLEPSSPVASDTTLATLAQRNYPLQPKAREKYVRMMRAANPELDAATPIGAGTQLSIPAGLPLRRIGPYRPEAKAATPAPAAVARPTVADKVAPPRIETLPARDVLRLGVAPSRSPAELLAEAERLAEVLVQQTQMQDEIAESLTRLEGTFNGLKQHYVSMEARLASIEAERLAEKAAAKSRSQVNGLAELLLAVLAGGALGGLGLHAYKKRRQPAPVALSYDVPTVAAYFGSQPAKPTVDKMPSRAVEKSSLSFTEGS